MVAFFIRARPGLSGALLLSDSRYGWLGISGVCPADDWVEDRVDFNQRFVPHPEAAFFFRVCGDSMVSPIAERSIPDKATLIVDRSREAKHDDIVVAILNDEFTIKRLYQRGNRLALIAENPAYPPIVLNEEQELSIWGVATAWIMEPR